MINRIYRLMDTKRIEVVQREIEMSNNVILACPRYVSVCSADQRYYQGDRSRAIMQKKLPMALIHEAVADVIYSADSSFPKGSMVVPIPLLPNPSATVKSNYDEKSTFRSSGQDGFLCDYISASKNGFVLAPSNQSVVYVFSEMISVVINVLEAFEQSRVTGCDSFGVWGDGSIGYTVSLILRIVNPNAKIYAFGKTARKLRRFSFVDETFFIDDIPQGLRINHAFECAGGVGSELAIRQIIQVINPQGCVNLLGVSEEEISINTRTVLDKGLKLLGNSRSDAGDFQKAVKFISENAIVQRHLETLVSEVVDIKNENDIAKLFENDALNDFKTVGRWLL